jgi:argininosuccinate lyase
LPTDGYPAFTTAFEHHVGRKPAADAAEFARMVSPEHFVAVRGRFGGPAPAALDAAFAGYREALDGFDRHATDIAQRQSAAAAELERRVHEIAKGG